MSYILQGRVILTQSNVVTARKVAFMSPSLTIPSTASRSTSRTPRWMAARPETRVGIDLGDCGFRVSATRVRTHCASLDAPELKIECLHRVVESTPSIVADVAGYLDAFAARLPRYATRGGVAASIAVPPAIQTLRCVPSSQLSESERGIADELGGAVQCRTWPVGSHKSMICGVRCDIAEALISILGESGYRCESILPRSVAVARTHLAVHRLVRPSEIILCWDRHRSLITTIHGRTIRLCREIDIDEFSHTTQSLSSESRPDASVDSASTEDRLSQISNELANEIILTLQHACRLDNRITPSAIVVCGEMSGFPGALQGLQKAMDLLHGIQVEPWKIPIEEVSPNGQCNEGDLANAVAISLAIGGCKIAIDPALAGGKVQ